MRKQIRICALWRYRKQNTTEQEQLALLEKKRPKLTVRRVHCNETDTDALLVLDGKEKVGYVNADDIRWIEPIMKESKTRVMLAFSHTVPSADGDSGMLIYTVDVDEKDVQTLKADAEWTGLCLDYPCINVIEELDMLDYALDELWLMLNGDFGTMTMQDAVNTICENCKYDLSIETTNRINDCCLMLEKVGDKESRLMLSKLEHASTRRRSKKGLNEYGEWWQKICKTNKNLLAVCKNRMRRRLNVNRITKEMLEGELDRIELDLSKAPFELGTMIDEVPLLMHKTFYHCMDRDTQMELLSALALRQQIATYLEGKEKKAEKANVPDKSQNEDRQKLIECFYSRDDAEDFMRSIQGLRGTEITAMVRQFARERRISDMSCYKPLWEALHEMGIYKYTLSNWNQQIG